MFGSALLGCCAGDTVAFLDRLRGAALERDVVNRGILGSHETAGILSTACGLRGALKPDRRNPGPIGRTMFVRLCDFEIDELSTAAVANVLD